MRKASSGTRPWVPPELWIALVALGLVVSWNVVPGVFSVDDNNYLVNALALRDGRVTVANTEGLTPSRELLFFDPGPWSRDVTSTPVASTAPPLYGPIALPFSFMRWRGLVALNTLAYLATILMVFWYARRYSAAAHTPWLAAGAFALGGFAIEYTQGVWPHTLSIAVCTAGIVAAGRVIDSGRPGLAAAAGVLLGLAAGIRYQNVVLLGAVGAAIALLSPRRKQSLLAFALAAALPIAVSSAMNHERLDSWNPVSKGKGYMNVPALQAGKNSPLDPAVMFWSQLVDYSARPQLTGHGVDSWLGYDPVTGAHLMLFTIVKKAFLQSAPWAVLGFVLFALSWSPWSSIPHQRRRQLQLLSLVTFAVVGIFSMAAVTRHDGYSFNARYFLELLPIAAIGFAWSLDQVKLRSGGVLAGAGLGAVVVLAILFGTPAVGGPDVPLWTTRHLLLLKVPVLLAAALTVCWIAGRNGQRFQPVLSVAIGLCLGWAFTIHVADDIPNSHRTRRYNLARTQALATVLTDRTALVAWWWHKDPAVPLLFDRDIVILDARADNGDDAPVLIRELLGRGRRVLLLEDGFPADVLERVVAGLHPVPVAHAELKLQELRLEATPVSASGGVVDDRRAGGRPGARRIERHSAKEPRGGVGDSAGRPFYSPRARVAFHEPGHRLDRRRGDRASLARVRRRGAVPEARGARRRRRARSPRLRSCVERVERDVGLRAGARGPPAADDAVPRRRVDRRVDRAARRTPRRGLGAIGVTAVAASVPRIFRIQDDGFLHPLMAHEHPVPFLLRRAGAAAVLLLQLRRRRDASGHHSGQRIDDGRPDAPVRRARGRGHRRGFAT